MSQVQQWEYKEESRSQNTPDWYFLNEMGKEGWELVWIYDDPTCGINYIFKRPKQ